MKHVLLSLMILTAHAHACGFSTQMIDFGVKTPRDLGSEQIGSDGPLVYLDATCPAGDYDISVSTGWASPQGLLQHFSSEDPVTNSRYSLVTSNKSGIGSHSFIFHNDPTSPQPVFTRTTWFRINNGGAIRPGIFNSAVGITVTPIE